MKRNKLVPHKLITNIEVLNTKAVFFVYNLKGKDKLIDSDVLQNMTFSTVYELFKNNKIFNTKVVEEEKVIITPKNKQVKVTNNDVSNSRISLNDIYE